MIRPWIMRDGNGNVVARLVGDTNLHAILLVKVSHIQFIRAVGMLWIEQHHSIPVFDWEVKRASPRPVLPGPRGFQRTIRTID